MQLAQDRDWWGALVNTVMNQLVSFSCLPSGLLLSGLHINFLYGFISFHVYNY
jgi:hypothetical protein